MAIELDLELITTVDTEATDRTNQDDGCRPMINKASMCSNGIKALEPQIIPDSPK